jgi:hypothetical protein
MRSWLWATLLGCAQAGAQDEETPSRYGRAEIVEALKDPARVFPLFQDLLRDQEYSKAHGLLSAKAKTLLPYEAFYFMFTGYEAARRLVLSAQVHALDPAGPAGYRLRLCNPEFGVGRDFRLSLWEIAGQKLYPLDLNSDDIEYFRGRALKWYRLQLKRADGWHFAYPPDWTYAPLARTCICGK